jgi:hypothetical protein
MDAEKNKQNNFVDRLFFITGVLTMAKRWKPKEGGKMKVKIWEVEFGTNYSRCYVSARNYREAVEKAIKKTKPPRSEQVTKVKLIAEED